MPNSRSVFLSAVAALLIAGHSHSFDIYVSDAGNFNNPPWQILRYDSDGLNPEVFTTQQLGWPQDLLFLEDQGVVLISNLNTNRINRHDAETGDYLDTFAQDITQPTRMAIGPDGLIYALQWAGSGKVRRYKTDGTARGNFTSVGVSQAIGLAWDAKGDLYVASFNQAHVRRFDAEGNDLGLFVQANLQGPTNLWFEGDELLVLDWSGGVIQRFDENGTLVGTFAAGLSQPEGIARLPSGNLVVGNGGTGSVREYTPAGSYVGDRIGPGAGGLLQPNAVVVRASGVPINATTSDAWVDPRYPSQGMLLMAYPTAQQIFGAWFAYNDDVAKVIGAPDQRWFTLQGAYQGPAAQLTIYSSSGGVFNAATPPAQTDPVGSAYLEQRTCDEARLYFQFDDSSRSGEMALQRLADENIAACEAKLAR